MFYIYAKNKYMLEYSPDSKSIQILTNSSLLFIPSGCEVFNWCCHHPSFRFLALVSPLEISILMIEMFSNAQLPWLNHLVDQGHLVSEISSQIQKAKIITRSEIIKEKPRRQNNRVPFITTYNPGLPNLSSVIQKHYHILQRSERLKVFNEPPMVAFRKPKSLRQYLVKAKVNNNAESVNVSAEVPGCYKLHNSRCRLCHVLRESDHFTSNVTKRTWRIKDHIDCKSKGVIYLVTCEDCGKQYVDETGTAFLTRHYGHKSDLTKKPLLPLSKHFNKAIVHLRTFQSLHYALLALLSLSTEHSGIQK